MFKLDTGVEVTAISEEAYEMLQQTTLQNCSRILYGPTFKALQVLGQFIGMLSTSQRSSEETVFVVCGLKTNLLGLPAITSLDLIRRIGSTDSTTDDIANKFRKVFTGLGNLGNHTRSNWRKVLADNGFFAFFAL